MIREDIDKGIEIIWDMFSDVPTNIDNTIIEADFHIWSKGADIIDIWCWFNKEHSKGIEYLVYNHN